MINIWSLKVGDKIKSIVQNVNYGLNIGDILTIVETGFSRWDNMHYADAVTEKGHKIEIIKNFDDFEMIA